MRSRWLALPAVAAMALVAWAQDEDGPGRGVARLSVINGDVSVRRGDSGDWVAGAVNAPLVVQDHVMTGPASRAEIQFDWANMLRLGSDTEVRLSELEHRRYQVQVVRGAVMLRVLRDIDAEIEVNTPSVSVRPVGKGSFRVTVREAETEITARSGEAEIYSPRGAERLRSGRTMLVRGATSDPEFRMTAAVPRDRFDEWNESRDRYLERTRSYRYVSRDIYGADELDYYGRWVWVAPYGWVWTPWGVAAWWAPYRYGRWVWIDWYGWTWLSYDPWGWAPFHYGRWFWHAPYGWCWYPGPRHYRHYWRPALVAFVGFHVGGVHVGIGFGRIGWIPLAPYEPYYPWYGPRFYHGFRGPTYIDNSVRIVNNVQIVNIYRNARVVNAISGVDGEGFVRGGRIQSLRVSEAELTRASLVQGPLPVVPARDSVRFADRPVRVAAPPDRSEPDRFFSRRPAAPVERVSFEEQRRGMEHVVRRTFGPPAEGVVTSVRAGEPASGGDPVRGPSDQQPAGGIRGEPGNMPRGEGFRIWRAESDTDAGARSEGRGWRRIGEPVRSETPVQPTEAGAPAGAGWRWIGEPVRGEAGSLPRTESTERGQWQRFGTIRRDPAGAAPVLEERGGQRFGETRQEAESGPAPPENRGWRRFGEIRRDARETPPAPDNRGWRRFGEIRGGEEPSVEERSGRRFGQPLNRDRGLAGASPESEPPGGIVIRGGGERPAEGAPPAVRRQDEGGWRRFSAPRIENRSEEAEPGRSAPRWESPRWAAPEWRSAPRRAEPRDIEPREAEPRSVEPRRAEPILINPPILRERAAPRWESAPRWGGEIRGGAGPSGEGRGTIRGEPRGGGEVRGGGMSRSAEGGARGGGRVGGPR